MVRSLFRIAVLGLFFSIMAGVMMESGDLPKDPRHDNPRRPSPENFTPRAWDAETRSWLTAWPKSQRNEIPDGVGLPREGVILGSDKRQSSTGTAFSINGTGLWLTARHVAEGCDVTWLQIAPKKGLKVERTVLHPKADVAVLETRGGPDGLPLETADMPRRQDSFHVGFPKGQPGAVHSRYLGEMVMRHRGRGGFREMVNVWSELSRIPGRFGSLGGLSGGAVLDNAGRIVGVVEAESQRRGRIMTAQPATLREVLNLAQVAARTDAAPLAIDTGDYPTAARRLITTLRIVRVICRVNPSS